MPKISDLAPIPVTDPLDEVPIRDVSANSTRKVTLGQLTGYPAFGWSAVVDTWTFSSWNSTTNVGVINVPSDATTKYAVDNFIQLTQPTGGTKYGKIMSLTATTLTLWLPGYTLTNETITAPMFSPLASPIGVSPAFYKSTPYKCSVYRNASFSAADGTVQTLLFDTKLYDTNNNFNTATGVFTAPVSGYYDVKVTTEVAGVTGTNGLWEGRANLQQNTSTTIDYVHHYLYDHATYTTSTLKMNGLHYLNAGDTLLVQVMGDTQSSGAYSISPGRQYCRFEAKLDFRI